MEQILEFLLALDEKVFLLFNGMQNDFWSNFMPIFTGRFVWVPMYAMILVLLFRSFNWKTATIYAVAVILAIVFADQICATFIRPYVERLRPSHLENPLSQFTMIVDGYRGGRYGFPSCHAANSFALATILSLIASRRWFTWFILCWAFVNSYTRLYLGVHYPGDLIVGGLIGALLGWLLFTIARKISSRYASTTPADFEFERNLFGGKLSMRRGSSIIAVGGLTAIIIALIAAVRTFMG